MATITLQVAASGDDAIKRINSAYFSTSYTAHTVGNATASYYQHGGGLRFTNVTVPQGATINSAHIELRGASALATSGCNTYISAEPADSPATFSTEANFDTRRANKTTAKVAWDNMPTVAVDTWYSSPEIKTVIQEIVNRAGWASGNAIVIWHEDWDNRSSVGGRREFKFFDSAAASAPKLVITYNEPPPDAGTLTASGTQDSQVLGRAKYGDIWLGYTEAGTGPDTTSLKVYRSDAAGGTYTEITANCTITQPTATTWLIRDKRPNLAPAIAYGATAYYKVKATGAAGDSAYTSVASATAQPDKAAIRSAKTTLMRTIFGANSYLPSSASGEPYPANVLMERVLSWADTGVAQHLTDATNQFNYIKAKSAVTPVINDASDVLMLYGTTITREFMARTVLYAWMAGRVLAVNGETTLSAAIRSQVDTWVTAYRGLTRSTLTRAGLANNQTAWATGTAYQVNDVVRPSTGNTHQYVCVTAHTSSTEPTWTATAGALCTGTDGTKWREDTVSGAVWAQTYSTGTYTPSGYNVDLNQQLSAAALLAAVYTDSNSSHYNNATVKSLLDDQVNLILRYQKNNGAVALDDSASVYYDTNYGSFSLYLAACVKRLMGSSYNARLNTFITKGLAWLTASYGSETTIGGGYYSAHDPDVEELLARNVAYWMESTTNPLGDIAWTIAFNVPATDKWNTYVQYGTAAPAFADPVQCRFRTTGEAAVYALDIAVPMQGTMALDLTAAGTLDLIPATQVDLAGAASLDLTAAGTLSLVDVGMVDLAGAATLDLAMAGTLTVPDLVPLELTGALALDMTCAGALSLVATTTTPKRPTRITDTGTRPTITAVNTRPTIR